ncbi:MAG TPA: hypothetical protein VEX63_06205 [Flavisolibacter sp.]|nr:hypothetical protein [Flavisolibacter sp.]
MKIARFVNELKKTRGAKAYVIVYADPKMAENVTYLIRNTNWMFQKRKIAPDRIVLLKGGFREHTTAEFFIVPKGAVPPVPTPTIDDKGMTLRP